MEPTAVTGELIERASTITHRTDEGGRRIYWALAYEEGVVDSYSTTLARGAFDGVTTADFRILVAHQRDADPVGKPVELTYTDRGLEVGFVFADTDRAREVEALVSGGFYRAVSVGFVPVEGAISTRDDGVVVYERAELKELSLVNVPASSGATIDLTRALEWRTTDPYEEAAAEAAVDAGEPAEVVERACDACECGDDAPDEDAPAEPAEVAPTVDDAARTARAARLTRRR
jgi:HK97 family phage prohead protease